LATQITRGDIYDVDWNPARGSEQVGIRRSLVIQNNTANRVTAYGVTIVLAISSKIKGYPSMVLVQPSDANGLDVESEVNTAQIITVSKDRLRKYYGFLSPEDMKQVEVKLGYMLGLRLAE
jgi:mRNA interferase MazF